MHGTQLLYMVTTEILMHVSAYIMLHLLCHSQAESLIDMFFSIWNDVYQGMWPLSYGSTLMDVSDSESGVLHCIYLSRGLVLSYCTQE